MVTDVVKKRERGGGGEIREKMARASWQDRVRRRQCSSPEKLSLLLSVEEARIVLCDYKKKKKKKKKIEHGKKAFVPLFQPSRANISLFPPWAFRDSTQFRRA